MQSLAMMRYNLSSSLLGIIRHYGCYIICFEAFILHLVYQIHRKCCYSVLIVYLHIL